MTIKADPIEFAGKRVLISGGTKGLGRATVDRFLAGGARVITAARETMEPIDGVEFVRVDLTTAEGGETLAKAALEVVFTFEHGLARDGVDRRHSIVRASHYRVSEAVFTKLAFLH